MSKDKDTSYLYQ